MCHILDSTYNIIWYLCFSFWLTSLSMLISKSIHIATNDINYLLLWLCNIPLCVCHFFVMHSSSNGYLGCFSVWAIINNMNIGVHVSFWIIVLSRYVLKRGIVESYGNSVFGFLRNLYAVLHSGLTNLHSHHSVGSFPFLHTLSSICYL